VATLALLLALTWSTSRLFRLGVDSVPFRNPIVAGLTLIRAAIRSNNYVAGISGWTINRDGSAEFNNVTIRGALIVGDPFNASGLAVTNSPLPTELATYYSPAILANAFIRMAAGDGTYNYEIVGDKSGDYTIWTRGIVDTHSVVHKLMSGAWFDATGVLELDLLSTVDTDARLIVHGSYTALTATLTEITKDLLVDGVTSFDGNVHMLIGNTLIADSGSNIRLDNGSNLVINSGADFTIDGVDQPRGLIYYERITAAVNSGAVVGTFTATFTTTNNINFIAGRAYQVVVNTLVKSTALQNPAITIFKNTVAGTALITGGRIPISVAGQDFPVNRDDIIINATGATVTAKIAVGINPGVATLVTMSGQPAPSMNYIKVIDVGAAADYSANIQI